MLGHIWEASRAAVVIRPRRYLRQEAARRLGRPVGSGAICPSAATPPPPKIAGSRLLRGEIDTESRLCGTPTPLTGPEAALPANDSTGEGGVSPSEAPFSCGCPTFFFFFIFDRNGPKSGYLTRLGPFRGRESRDFLCNLPLIWMVPPARVRLWGPQLFFCGPRKWR